MVFLGSNSTFTAKTWSHQRHSFFHKHYGCHLSNGVASLGYVLCALVKVMCGHGDNENCISLIKLPSTLSCFSHVTLTHGLSEWVLPALHEAGHTIGRNIHTLLHQ